ncbi:MAG: hypothetical protein WCH74_01030, partial [Chloroflexota bacterium]
GDGDGLGAGGGVGDETIPYAHGSWSQDPMEATPSTTQIASAEVTCMITARPDGRVVVTVIRCPRVTCRLARIL